MRDEYKNITLSSLHNLPAGVLTHSAELPFDLYTCDNASNCILFGKKSFKLQESKIKELTANKTKIFIQKNELPELKKYLKETAAKIVSDNGVSRDEKSRVIYNSAIMVVEDLFNNTDSKEAVEDTKELATVMLGGLLKDNATFLSMVGVLSYDYYTYSHCVNVCLYSIAIGKKLKLEGKEIEDLAHAAMLHDIGKAHISPQILNKEGALSSEEFEIIKTHTTEGVVILESLKEKNQNILDSVVGHHEKMDGSGYPYGLDRHKIPYFAQIIAVADIFDALTTKRSYKEALGSFAALKIMRDRMASALNEEALRALVESFRH